MAYQDYKMYTVELIFPTRAQLDEERRNFHLKMGMLAGIPEEIIKGQIDIIGKSIWEHVYAYMKLNTKIDFNSGEDR